MFRDVPGCSGMFRNVPCSGFYRRPDRGPFFMDLIKVRGFHFTPALHTHLRLGLACLKNSKQ